MLGSFNLGVEWGKREKKATSAMALCWNFGNKIYSQFASDGVGKQPSTSEAQCRPLPARLNAGAMAIGVRRLGWSAGTTTLTGRRGRLVDGTIQDVVCR